LYAVDDPDSVLHRLVEGACNALDASRAVLIRCVTPASPVTVTHEYAIPGIRPATELVDVAASRTWAQMAAQPDGPLPIAVDDIGDHAELAARWAPVPEQQRPYAILAVPVIE